MSAAGLLLMFGVVATGWHLVNWKPAYRDALPERDGAGIGRDSLGKRTGRTKPKTAAPRSGSALTAHELAGLVDVDCTADLVLVSPRGVELPYSPDWDLDDVIAYLVEVDAL